MAKNIQQKLEKPREYNNWLIRNAFSLISFPFSVLAIILGLYGEVFDNLLTEEDVKLRTIINFIYEEQNIARGKKAIFNCILAPDTFTYNHLIIVDRTASTINPEIELNSSKFKREAMNFINDDFDLPPYYKSSLKDCIFKNYLQLFIKSEETSKIRIAFYDGNKIGFTYYKFGYKKMPDWLPCNDETSKVLIASIIKDTNLLNTNNKKEQETNFKEIFNQIKKLDKKNLIITILSDFDNDVGKLSENDIRSTNNKGNIKRLNLIYLPPSSIKRKVKSNNLVKDIDNYLNNDVVNTCPIYANDLLDENHTNTTFTKYCTKLTECFTTNNLQKENIEFFFPSFDLMKNNNIKRTISIQSATKAIKWRIFCKEDFFGTYRRDESTFNFKTNIWEEINASEELELSFNKTKIIDKNLHFDILNPENGNILRYKINPKRYIPATISNVAILCMNLIALILILLIPAHTFKILNYANYNLHLFQNKKWIIIESIFAILIIVLILFIFLKFNFTLFWVLGIIFSSLHIFIISTIWINYLKKDKVNS